jgi:protein-disulfide isomerase
MSTSWTGATIIATVGRMLAGLACVLLLGGAALTPGKAADLPDRSEFVLPAAGSDDDADPALFGALGDPGAPVTIIAFISMTCCAQFWDATLPELNSRYIDTGKVRLIFVSADELSTAVLLLAACSGPDQYFQMLETLFARRREWVVAEPREPLMKITGLPEHAFDACLAGPQARAYFEQSRAIVAKLGRMPPEPTFIINGNILSGDVSITEMEQQFAPNLKNRR